MSAHFMTQPRRSTPTIPPGFTAPAVPRAVVEESKSRPGSRPMSRTPSSSIAPVVPLVPVVPVTPIRAATPSRAKKNKQPIETPPAPATKAQPETPTKTSAKTPAAKTPVNARATKGSEDAGVQRKLQQKAEEKQSVLDATKETPKAKGNKKISVVTDASPQKKAAKEAKAEVKEATHVPVPMPASSSKRQPPGKLDITAATQVPVAEQSPVQVKNARAAPAIAPTASVPASPATVATGSPIKRTTAPRTLRVVPTPKTEAPPPLSATTAPSMPQVSTVEKLRSRQASIASVNLPGTPASEMISDTASVTSASVSRASSPPPVGGKVGTAPVRKKTKSQAKKDRQERKRQIEEDMVEEDIKSDVEVMQAPIVGRKKKTKKPTTTPKIATKSQPVSPKPATVEDDHSDAPAPTVAAKTPQTPKTPTPPTPEPEHFYESKDKREHTAQSILADLQKTGELLASTLEFFKPLSSSLTHASRSAPLSNTAGPPDLKIHFSEADLEAIAKKKPVRLTGHDDKADSRTLITPNGKFFWGLSEELEEKALQLEKQIEELRGHTRFHPRKQSAHSHSYSSSHPPSKDVLPAIATALKEAGKKLGTNSTQQMPEFHAQLDKRMQLPPSMGRPQEQQQPAPPQPQHPQQPQTPTDAGAYLNQFVLPRTDNPPPNQPRPEMAAVGGAPGAGTANISVNAGKFAKAAKAVVEGGAVGSTEIDGMGLMAADLLGGVFVQGLEALVGAGLGFESSSALQQEFGLDADGNITIGRGGTGLDVQGLMSAIGNAGGFGAPDALAGGPVGAGAGAGRFGRGSVMSLEEAERAMHAARKEHDVLEKKLAALMKKNKKLFGGMGKV
ncbi:hypothetical protein DE146DRAFT_39838 [Phaeosphaeria sp. MPI-PUGE-AT-0046c]|nr:hypothetical protein DE146DRAFT_39838 [Phaeosphaeria sp. MPI-PUGE-AT-0046c]